MRPVVLVAALVFPLLACESEKAVPTTVSWMEWPADVEAGTPFRVRMVVFWPCASEGFRVGHDVDPAVVTLKPYFSRQRDDIMCALAQPVITTADLVVGTLDTAGFAPPLRVTSLRELFQMKAPLFGPRIVPAIYPAPDATTVFGEVTVHAPSDQFESDRRNAGGFARVEVGQDGCVRIRTGGAYGPKATLVLDNPADTIGLSNNFVRGYVYEPAAPVCGETEVFRWIKVYLLDTQGA